MEVIEESKILGESGWVEGLPPVDLGECWLRTLDEGVVLGHTFNMEKDIDIWEENVTHWRRLIKPEQSE